MIDMIKYFTYISDKENDAEYWINKEIEKYLSKGYKVLSAGVNDKDSNCAYNYTFWVSMIKEE